MLLTLSVHCAPKKKPAPVATLPATRPLGPPIIDAARGGGSFPIEATTLPANITELRKALVAGYAKRLLPPVGATTQAAQAAVVIKANGETPDSLDALRINLSGYRVRPDYEPSQLDKSVTFFGRLHADEVAYTAKPIQYAKGKMSVELKARDAELDLLQDKNNLHALILSGAKSGSLNIRAKRADMEAIAFAAAAKGASKGGVLVTEVSGTLTSDNPRSLEAYITIRGLWLLLPLEITAGGRIDVGDDMVATFSKVSCTGRGPGGDIAAPFLDKQMKKLNGRAAPLMAFRDGKTHAKDFHISLGDDLHLQITFGQ